MVAGGQSLSGELDIYPNSPTYVGNIGTAVYDSVNSKRNCRKPYWNQDAFRGK